MASLLSIARARHSHATNWPGANLDRFSGPRSGEPHGWGEQSSTVKSGFQTANNLAFCRLNGPSSARDIKAPNTKEPRSVSGVFFVFRFRRITAHRVVQRNRGFKKPTIWLFAD